MDALETLQGQIDRITTEVTEQANYISQITAALAEVVQYNLTTTGGTEVVSQLETNTNNLSQILSIIQGMQTLATQTWVTTNFQTKIQNGTSLPSTGTDNDIYLLEKE